MSAPWVLAALETVVSALPELLEQHGEGNEADAIKELADTYQARRTGGIADRSDEIAKDRAAVDARLAERAAKPR